MDKQKIRQPMLSLQCCKRVVDSVLKRGGTPIPFALLTAAAAAAVE